MPDGAGGFGLAWKAAKDVNKCDGNCGCPDCNAKKKPDDAKAHRRFIKNASQKP